MCYVMVMNTTHTPISGDDLIELAPSQGGVFLKVVKGRACCPNENCGYVAEPLDHTEIRQHIGNMLAKDEGGSPLCPLCHNRITND